MFEYMKKERFVILKVTSNCIVVNENSKFLIKNKSLEIHLSKPPNQKQSKIDVWHQSLDSDWCQTSVYLSCINNSTWILGVVCQTRTLLRTKDSAACTNKGTMLIRQSTVGAAERLKSSATLFPKVKTVDPPIPPLSKKRRYYIGKRR